MDIAFVSRSDFLTPCEQAIQASNTALATGETIRILLEKADPGYRGRIVVELREGDDREFGTNWTSNDPTRFPARIRAAATALFRCHCYGRYLIAHTEGIIEIRQAQFGEWENP